MDVGSVPKRREREGAGFTACPGSLCPILATKLNLKVLTSLQQKTVYRFHINLGEYHSPFDKKSPR